MIMIMQKTPEVLCATQETKETFHGLDDCNSEAMLTCVCFNTQVIFNFHTAVALHSYDKFCPFSKCCCSKEQKSKRT